MQTANLPRSVRLGILLASLSWPALASADQPAAPSPPRVATDSAAPTAVTTPAPDAPAAAAPLAPLAPEVAKAFRAVREDPPPKHIIRGIHYVISNENRHNLWRDSVKDLGGVFVGVGTDQNYVLSGWSHPEVMVLTDFDQVVVDLHRVYRLLFLKADSPENFLSLWKEKHAAEVRSLIEKGYADPVQRQGALEAFRIARGTVERRLHRVKHRYHHMGIPTFLSDQAEYAYLRGMFQADRVFMVRGDLTKDRALRDVAKAAQAANLPLRVLYLSNAERYFGYEPDFRDNFLSMGLDARSLVLRTANFHHNSYEYNQQSGPNFQAWLRFQKTASAKWMLRYGQWDHARGITMVLRTPDDLAARKPEGGRGI